MDREDCPWSSASWIFVHAADMDIAAAFVAPQTGRSFLSPGFRQPCYGGAKSPRRPRVLCRASEGGSDHSSNKKGSEGSNARPSFIDYVGRQISELKSEADSKDADGSQPNAAPEQPPNRKSWLPGWGPKRSPENPKPIAGPLSNEGRKQNARHPLVPRDQTKPDSRSKNSTEKNRVPNPFESFFTPMKRNEEKVSTEENSVDEKKRSNLNESSGKNVPAELWKRVVDVIIPNRDRPRPMDDERTSSKFDQSKYTESLRSDEFKEQGGDDCNGEDLSTTENRHESAETRKKGIEELYEPPPLSSPGDTQRGLFGYIASRLPDFLMKRDSQGGRNLKDKSSSSRPSSNADGIPDDRPDVSLEHYAGNDDSPISEEGDADAQRNLPDSEIIEDMSSAEHSSKSNVPAERVLGKSVASASSFADVSTVPQSDVAAIRMIFGSETFFATETLSPPGGLIFRGNLRGEPSVTLEKLEKRLEDRLGDKYTLCLAEGEEDLRPVVVVVPTARDKRSPSPRQRFFSSAIAGLTLSTSFARATQANRYVTEFRASFGVSGIAVLNASRGRFLQYASTRLVLQYPIATIAIAIIAVVLISQVAQRLMARHHKTRIGLPYLIPSFQLGSFGAIVQVASPTPTRSALFDIALAGAATLVFSSLGLLLVGLWLSVQAGALVVPVPMSTLSSSLILGWLTKTMVGGGRLHIHKGLSLVGLHPVAIIGANCLFIAALNLLPIRQLDGGRIVSAIYGRKTAILASRVTIFFLLLASARTSYLFVFLALVMFGPWSLDRPAKNELTEPNAIRAVVGYVFLLFMLSVLLPYPSHVPFKLD
jgi:hypothetical protein